MITRLLDTRLLHAATNNRHADNNDIRSVNLGPIALFSKYKLTTSSGKQLENIEHGRVQCLMYKLFTIYRQGCDDLSIGFDHSRDRRQPELTNNKKLKGKNHVRFILKDIFGFAQHQLKGTYGLGYILTLTRNKDSAVLNKDNAINNAKIKINSIHWYVPHYTPSVAQQAILIKENQNKTPTELQYPDRSTFMKAVNPQSLRIFELGTQKSINVPICNFAGFQQKDRQDSQNLNNDTFYRPAVTNSHVVISTNRYPDNSIFLNYDEDDYSQGYGKLTEAFKALTQDDILQSYLSEHDFRSNNDGDNSGYRLYAFDVRYQKNFKSAQPIEVEFKFSEYIPAGIYGYALVLTNRLVSIAADGQRMFDLV